MIGASREFRPDKLRALLELALKQLSIYAQELNAVDGGNRKVYDDIEIWKKDNAATN